MYWEVLPGKVMARIAQERSAAASPGRPAAWWRLIGLRWMGALAVAVLAVFVGLEVWTFRERDLATPSIAKKGDSVESPKPVLRSEIEEPDRQPLTPTAPAVPGAEDEVRESSRMAPEPSLEDEPVEVEATEQRPAAPVSSRDPSAPRSAGLAGPADRREQVEGLVSKTRVAALSQDEAALGVSEEKEIVVGRASSSLPPSSAPAEAQVLQEELASDMRSKENYLTPGEPARKRRSAAYQTLSIQTSSVEIQTECRDLRTYLAQNPDAEQALDARYRLALCSIRLFKTHPSEDTHRQAGEDCNAFLELSPEGERADEIRKALEPIKN